MTGGNSSQKLLDDFCRRIGTLIVASATSTLVPTTALRRLFSLTKTTGHTAATIKHAFCEG